MDPAFLRAKHKNQTNPARKGYGISQSISLSSGIEFGSVRIGLTAEGELVGE